MHKGVLFFTTSLLAFMFSLTCVCAADSDSVGYDENTEIIVSGTVLKSSGCEFRGLKCFVLESNSRSFNVITAPSWFVERIHMKLSPGMTVRVVGSKFYGTDGALYLVARSVKTLPTGRSIQFRDNNCKPVWSKRVIKRSSCMKIFFVPGQSM